MPEMHLKKSGFTYSACGPFTWNKKRIQKLKETGDTKYICKNELDKACFHYDMACGDFKDLAKRTGSDNVLRNKAFKIVSNPKYDKYQRGLASIVYKFKKTLKGSGVATLANKSVIKNEIRQNQQLAEELYKPIIRKVKKRRVYSSFKDNIWGADLVDMQLISKVNKSVRFLLCVIDIYSKYAWIVPLKDKKGVTIVNTFQKILDDSMELHSMRKPNKTWIDKGSQFYKRSI